MTQSDPKTNENEIDGNCKILHKPPDGEHKLTYEKRLRFGGKLIKNR